MELKIAAKIALLLKDENFRKKLGTVILVIFFLFTGIFSAVNVQNLKANGEEASTIFSAALAQKESIIGDANNLKIQLLYAVYSKYFAGNEDNYGGTVNVVAKLIKCFLTIDERSALTDTDSIYDRIEEEFEIKINVYSRQQLLRLIDLMPMWSMTDRSFLVHNLSDEDTKTNIGLCNFAFNVLNENCGYVYGAFGQDITMSYLKEQQRRFHGDADANLTDSEVQFIYDTFGGKPAFDCIGLIKAYLWLDTSSGNIQYASNGFSDFGANSIRETVAIKGNISNIPDIPGLAVWMDGHIGIYLGNGEVIEANSNRLGVIKSKLSDNNWTEWFQLPGITYVTSGTHQIDRWKVSITNGRAAKWAEAAVNGKGDFAWPLPSPYGKNYITSGAGGRLNPVTGRYENSHGAIDIGAPGGTPILASADGIVVYSGWDNSYGYFVKIKHNDTWSTLYAHSSKLLVSVGQYVHRGDTIALVGSTGDSTGNHLHFEIRENETRLDPIQFF